jgi:predicted DNA-binding transcriptional regulator AlpA
MACIPSNTRAVAHNADNVAPLTVRLISKKEIVAITGLSFPTVWKLMRAGKFPRSRIVGQKSKWRSDEIEQWLARLPIRKLKGDEASA